MGTELKTKMTAHQIKTFWGGNDKGLCVQVTASEPMRLHETIREQIQEEGFIQLTMEEAAALCGDLIGFIKEEARRRQSLLKDQLVTIKANERTVFHEVQNLPIDADVLRTTVHFISKFCPRHKKESERR